MSEDKKLFIETYGCQMNVADSEVVASIMGTCGYSLCDDINDADAVFINTCSIRDNAEQKVLGRLQFMNSLRHKKGKLIVHMWDKGKHKWIDIPQDQSQFDIEI